LADEPSIRLADEPPFRLADEPPFRLTDEPPFSPQLHIHLRRGASGCAVVAVCRPLRHIHSPFPPTRCAEVAGRGAGRSPVRVPPWTSRAGPRVSPWPRPAMTADTWAWHWAER
jgi:hypothetical protein